jgi:WD40 repeat protein
LQDGLKVVVGTANRSIGVLDVASHQYNTLVRSHTDDIHSLAISSSPASVHTADPSAGDDRTYDVTTVSSDSTIRVWDVKSAEQRFQFDAPGEVAKCVVYRPSQHSAQDTQDEIACGFESGCVRIFDIPSTSTLCEHTQHQGAVVQLLYSHDGNLLYSAGEDGQLCVYDVMRQYQPVKMLSSNLSAPNKAVSVHLALSPDSRLLAAAGLEEDCVQLLWADSLRAANPNGLRIPIRATSSNKSAAASSRNFDAMAFSPDGTELIAVSASHKLLRFQQLGVNNQAVPFSRYKYSATPPISTEPVRALTISPNGQYIVTAGADSCIRVWGYTNGGTETSGPPPLPAFQVFSAHSAEVNAVNFTPDGRRLVSVSTDNCILIWQFMGECGGSIAEATAQAASSLGGSDEGSDEGCDEGYAPVVEGQDGQNEQVVIRAAPPPVPAMDARRRETEGQARQEAEEQEAEEQEAEEQEAEEQEAEGQARQEAEQQEAEEQEAEEQARRAPTYDGSSTTADDAVAEGLLRMFERADRDGDGAVNKRELILALRREPELCEMLGLPAHIRQEDGSRDKFQRLFDSADHEDDRLLSVEEFQELILSVQQQQSPADTSSPAAAPVSNAAHPSLLASPSRGLERLPSSMPVLYPEAPPTPTVKHFQGEMAVDPNSPTVNIEQRTVVDDGEVQSSQQRIRELELALQRALQSQDQAQSGLATLMSGVGGAERV